MAQPMATQSNNGHRPNPEVIAKPVRRSFTAHYKLKILREADTCTQPGQIGCIPLFPRRLLGLCLKSYMRIL
jgi:hypothetical protein